MTKATGQAMAKAGGKFGRFNRTWRLVGLVTRPDGSQRWQYGPVDASPVAPIKKLSGKVWVPIAYARRPSELLAMGITGASRALAETSNTALDCAKPLKARYIETQLRELGTFPKARRNSFKHRSK
jgi:hypothetical protein